MIGERLKRARLAAGLSMAALGDLVGVSKVMISKYERGMSMPRSEVLSKLCDALEVRFEYFFRRVKVELGAVQFRAHAKIGKKALRGIEADVLDQAERWQMLTAVWPEFSPPAFVRPRGLPKMIASPEEAEVLADRVRSAWDLGSNPISNLIDELEKRGILVIVTSKDEANKFDGLQASVLGRPVIVVSDNWPGDRQRFTLARELGHLLLRERLPRGANAEEICKRFAAAFLLPACGARQCLGERRAQVEFSELHMLKHAYGVSMQACAHRARELNIVTDACFKKMWQWFNAHGYRKREPGDQCPKEKTLLFRRLVLRAYGEDMIGESKAGELLGIPIVEFAEERAVLARGTN